MLLRWTVDAVPDTLEGFAIQRRLKRGAAASATAWLDNYAPPGPKPYQNGDANPSNLRPFRTFAWTDHYASRGDRVSYRIAPFLSGATAPDLTSATPWTRSFVVGASMRNAAHQAFFNRGYVISQFISRYLDETYKNLDRLKAIDQLKKDITQKLDDRIRLFLAGQVRSQLVQLLDDAVRDKHAEVYAALFELNDAELLAPLVQLGPRAHLVLANGSVEKPKGVSAADARKQDENKAARKALLDAGVDVERKNRFVAPGALAHNKFMVVEESGKPVRVWTGSTNWTTTGLCTQLNNALLVEDGHVAQAYRDQWDLLRRAGSSQPASLAASNTGPDSAYKKPVSVHFTRQQGYADLNALGKLVQEAKTGILFLMFIPGASGVLADVRALAQSKSQLLVRGVVSTLPTPTDEQKPGPTTVKVTVVDSASEWGETTSTYDVVQPDTRKHATARWAAEITRQQFLSNVGHAIIHSKVLVIDPFTAHPIVVTGSHNFSKSASAANDENFIVVRGDRALAEAYAVNVDTAWRHYAYRVAPPHADRFGTAYLQALLDDQRHEERFWGLA